MSNINQRILESTNLIYSIASKYKDYYNIEDLYQAGCIGVIKVLILSFLLMLINIF